MTATAAFFQPSHSAEPKPHLHAPGASIAALAGSQMMRSVSKGAQTMTVGTSFGCAGQPAKPWNSAAWSRPSGAWFTFGMGSMGI